MKSPDLISGSKQAVADPPFGFQRVLTAALLVFGGLTLLSWPVGDFPLNDDWTYAKSVIRLVDEGVLDLGFSSAALVTQLYYGGIFVRIFGFSFTVLRLSTWISAVIFIVVLKKTLSLLDKTALFALFVILWFVLNPIYFSLCSTFMTDVNFCTLLICCFWQAAAFHRDNSWRALALFFVFSFLLVFLRQFGMLVPVAFTISCGASGVGRWRRTCVAAACTALIWLAFVQFESGAAAKSGMFYHSAGSQKLSDPVFWKTLAGNAGERWAALVANVAVWCVPLTALLLPLSKKARVWQIIIAVILAAFVSWLAYGPRAFPVGNVFINFALGAETFYESLIWPQDPMPHAFSPAVFAGLQVLQVLAVFCLVYMTALLVMFCASGTTHLRYRGFAVVLLVFIAGYVLALFMPEMFLDRYLLPLVLAIGLLFLTTDIVAGIRWPALLILVPFAFVAAAGTHDYFTISRIRWEAYRHLRSEKNVAVEKINGGYEVNGWHEGKPFNWYDHTILENHQYLIQYRPEANFVKYRSYPFFRYLSFGSDTISLYRRHDN